jgi:hypothetical protein
VTGVPRPGRAAAGNQLKAAAGSRSGGAASQSKAVVASQSKAAVGSRFRAATALAAPVLAVALLVTAAGAAAAPRAWAAPEPMSHCSTTTGVVMAVSFAHWGGPLLRSCASTPATAYGMLNQGGWQTTGTEHDGPGFICRIGYRGYQGGTQYPTAAQESCVLTPPSSAYWTFWRAGPGQNTWSYSQTGATGYSPPPGSVELWVFGGTNLGGTSGSAVPTISPASLRSNNKAPGSAVRTKHPADPAVHSAHPAAAPAQHSRPAATATTSAPASRSARTSTSSSSSPLPSISNAPPVAASDSQPASHGSALPAIIALVLVLLLAAAGIVAALRRPRRAR